MDILFQWFRDATAILVAPLERLREVPCLHGEANYSVCRGDGFRQVGERHAGGLDRSLLWHPTPDKVPQLPAGRSSDRVSVRIRARGSRRSHFLRSLPRWEGS